MFLPLVSSELEMFLGRYENANTRDQYRNSIAKFYSFIIRNQVYNLDAVTLEIGELFKSELEKMYSPKTCQVTIDTVKEFYKFLVSRRIITSNQLPLLKTTKVCSRTQKTPYVSIDEIKRMMRVTYLRNDRFSLTNRVMLLLMFNLGLRESELANLRLCDLTLQRNRYVVNVLGKGSKWRYLSVSEAVTNELQELFKQLNIELNDYLIQGSDRAKNHVKGRPISRIAIYNRIKGIAIKAKLEKNISPHALRRGTATHLAHLNTPIEAIARILGHSSTTVTAKYIAKEIDAEISARHALEVISN